MLDKEVFLPDHKALYRAEYQKRIADAPWKEWLSKPNFFMVRDEYLDKIHEWIHSTKLNKVTGLDRFKCRHMTVGSTHAFDEAYYRYSEIQSRRLRTFRGEYAYHKRIRTDRVRLDDKEGNYLGVEENDWVILSQPFCGNGGEQPHIKTLLDDCLAKGVPVVIDCAWYGTCRDIHIDVTHPAIKEVCFSLTKGIGLGNIRSGARYSNYEDDHLPIAQQNLYNHLPLSCAQVGIWQMDAFSPDNQWETFGHINEKLIKENGLIQTNCIHVALLEKGHPDYGYFEIEDSRSKVGLRFALKKEYKRLKDAK
tara:strand:- start:411 stop:1334 length:924 start_codon:yes stop_codon:yes gene_type:complete